MNTPKKINPKAYDFTSSDTSLNFMLFSFIVYSPQFEPNRSTSAILALRTAQLSTTHAPLTHRSCDSARPLD